MKQFELKAAKKAYHEIRNIQNARNMVEVESLISQAVQKAFGLWDIGMVAISMKRNDQGWLINPSHYNGNADLMKAVRYRNYDDNHLDVRRFLIQFIPERFHKTVMYQNIIAG